MRIVFNLSKGRCEGLCFCVPRLLSEKTVVSNQDASETYLNSYTYVQIFSLKWKIVIWGLCALSPMLSDTAGDN